MNVLARWLARGLLAVLLLGVLVTSVDLAERIDGVIAPPVRVAVVSTTAQPDGFMA